MTIMVRMINPSLNWDAFGLLAIYIHPESGRRKAIGKALIFEEAAAPVKIPKSRIGIRVGCSPISRRAAPNFWRVSGIGG